MLNVPSQILKLFNRSNEVIEWLALPKMAFAREGSIDFRCCELQPTQALFGTKETRAKLNQQMNVIGHHNRTIQVIAFAIEVTQRIHYNH